MKFDQLTIHAARTWQWELIPLVKNQTTRNGSQKSHQQKVFQPNWLQILTKLFKGFQPLSWDTIFQKHYAFALHQAIRVTTIVANDSTLSLSITLLSWSATTDWKSLNHNIIVNKSFKSHLIWDRMIEKYRQYDFPPTKSTCVNGNWAIKTTNKCLCASCVLADCEEIMAKCS